MIIIHMLETTQPTLQLQCSEIFKLFSNQIQFVAYHVVKIYHIHPYWTEERDANNVTAYDKTTYFPSTYLVDLIRRINFLRFIKKKVNKLTDIRTNK